jgi:hypothetical protein
MSIHLPKVGALKLCEMFLEDFEGTFMKFKYVCINWIKVNFEL